MCHCLVASLERHAAAEVCFLPVRAEFDARVRVGEGLLHLLLLSFCVVRWGVEGRRDEKRAHAKMEKEKKKRKVFCC